MLIFLIYAPAGFALALLRILMSVQYLLLLTIFPKKFFMRTLFMRFYFFVMGVLVTYGSEENIADNVNILVSNHISCFDSIAIEALIPCWRLPRESKIPSWVCWLFKFKNPSVPWTNDMEVLHNAASNVAYAFYPEEETTNGKVGLLKFSKSPFRFKDALVQPIVLLSHRPSFMPVNVSYIHSSFWSDLFWILFIPFTRYHISFMPARKTPDKEEGVEEFVKSLQKDMAYVLGIGATNLTAQDKKEYIKRIKDEERMKHEQFLAASQYNDRPTVQPKLKYNDNIEQMVKQVKLVLPQVPVKVVREDMKSTNNVDATISRLLEGTINYIPLTEEEQNAEKQKSTEIKIETKRPVIKSKNSFAKTSKDRHLSFQERKRIMIDEARQKYLQLHPEYS